MSVPPLTAGADIDPAGIVRFTVSRLPQNAAARDAVGLPLGAVVRPFAPLPVPAAGLPDAEALPRCADCAAYVCGFCQMERDGWVCALCGRFTPFAGAAKERYRRTARRGDLPELAAGSFECLVASQTVHVRDAPLASRPVIVALVDTVCDDAFLETVRSALLAALLAAGPSALFGLATLSHRVGLWDLQGDVPAVRHVPLAARGGADASTALELADALPLDAFLAPVDRWRDEIEAGLEALRPATREEREDASAQRAARGGAAAGTPGGEGARAFGPALDALLTYLGAPGASAAGLARLAASAGGAAAAGPRFPCVRVLAFVSGPPDAGAGALEGARWADAAPMLFPPGSSGTPTPAVLEAAMAAADALAAPQTEFYAEAGARAAAGGIVVDVFALPPAGGVACLDLASLAPLPRACGGALLLYPHGPADAPLPRDVHRILSQPTALHATLRLRTSPELRAPRAYGHVVTDASFDAIYHMSTCGPHDCVAFDFEFASSEGFSAPSAVDQPPAVQLAFEYTIILPAVEAADGDGTAGGVSFVRERRRRIVTAPAKMARTRRQVFETCDAEATAVLLAQKALRVATADGVAEARLMLTEWLAALVARASEAFPSGAGATPDASFVACPPLMPLPRAVFGLLCSPLLRALRAHPDARAHAAHLAAALPPDALARLLYPSLAGWRDAETREHGELALARAAMAAAGAPLYVLDAFTTVIVYGAPSPPGAPEHPFPPLHKSALRAALNALRDARPRTPRVLFIQGGVDDASPLEALLLDDGGGGEGALATFQAHVSTAAQEMLTQGE